MDEAAEVRAELRSYALRRCIRFYSAVLLFAALVIGMRLADSGSDEASLTGTGMLLFGLLAAVELASGVVMLQMAAVRARHPGPENALWRFAQGPHPSWLAAALFAAVSLVFLFTPHD